MIENSLTTTSAPERPGAHDLTRSHTKSAFGLNLSAGMEASVSAALSLLQRVLAEINNQELTQYQKMAEANKQAAIFSAKSTIQLGIDRFNEYLAQGLGGLIGGLTTFGAIGYGHFKNPYKSQLKQLGQEQKGIQNYQDAVQKRQAEIRLEVIDSHDRASTSQAPQTVHSTTLETAVDTQSIASSSRGYEEAQNLNESQQSRTHFYTPKAMEFAQSLNKQSQAAPSSVEAFTMKDLSSIPAQEQLSGHPQEQSTLRQTEESSQEIQRRLDQFDAQHKFTDANGKPLEVSQKYGPSAKYTDAELIASMDKNNLDHVEDLLNTNMKELIKKRGKLLGNQASRNSNYSSVGNTLSQISSNSGLIGAGKVRKEAGEDEAKSQLFSAASQGMQGIMGQLLKTANDAIQQVQQVIQTFATISNGNKIQG